MAPETVYLTVEEVAGRLKCSVPHVWGLLRSGKLVGIRPAKRRLVSEQEIARFLAAEQQEAYQAKGYQVQKGPSGAPVVTRVRKG